MKVALLAAGDVSALRRVIAEAGARLAWIAGDARSALERADKDTPEVLLIAIDDGWDAEQLTRTLAPRLRVMLVAADATAQIHRIYAALAAGAGDVATAPTADADPGRLGQKLRQLRGPRPSHPGHDARGPMLAIAASTGGPQALARVLADLPKELTAPVLLAQHIEPEFLPGLGTWLANASGRKVEIAESGAVLAPGQVLLVRADLQPVVDSARVVRYQRLDPLNPFHPCIDSLFESLARVRGLVGVAALLTGMGSDGARGLLALREAGWATMAQDAESSLVFGMPRAAVALSAAGKVLPLDGIGAAAADELQALNGRRR